LKKSLLILPLVLIASALALTACGGGSSSSGGGEEAAIEEAIETSGTSTDPSKCSEVQTAAFNESETGAKGKEALKTCEEEAEAKVNPAETVSVSNVEVNGERATAEVEVTGSALNNQGLEVEVTKEKGAWKLNKFLGFTNFDGKALGESLEKELLKEEGVTAALAKCISDGIAEVSQPEAEALVFEKNLEAVEKIAKKCE
jgi:hypothetical protein